RPLARVFYTYRRFLFWGKTLLHRYWPGGYGYMRTLRNHKEAFEASREMKLRYGRADNWQAQSNGSILRRQYNSYEDYVAHQKEKFDNIITSSGGQSAAVIEQYRWRFYHRFKGLQGFLPRSAIILCAGARQGTEVEVLRDLGFQNAYGIDLNPGPDNPYVVEGDFMNIDAATDSIDCIYTNCIDHAFDLNQFFAEHARVIKPDGYVLYDFSISTVQPGSFEATSWEHEHDAVILALRYFDKIIHMERDINQDWMWILMRGKRQH
ncbi:MAG: methyltransferase domain-containing protein, partial [Anaerolineae bacterium]|nr:methyltransferase domain-containing protein [Anaerolineae bacterium]